PDPALPAGGSPPVPRRPFRRLLRVTATDPAPEPEEPATLRRVEGLFFAALEKPEGEREAFLAREASGEDGIRAEASRLLRAHARDGAIPRSPAPTRVAATVRSALADAEREADEPLPGRVGPYRVLARIG